MGIDHHRRNAAVYPGRFVCADALHPPVSLADFDLIWASPPCQRFSAGTLQRGGPTAAARHPDLIPQTRALLAGHPFTIIENVPRAPIRADVVLTGPMVGLERIQRQRHFELSFWPGLMPPRVSVPRWMWQAGRAVTVTTSLSASSHYYPRRRAGLPGHVPIKEARAVMGITTPMTARQVGEAVPPPYAALLGQRARAIMEAKVR